MHLPFGQPHDPSGSFLPEDYLRAKQERRHNFVALTLFCVVMFGVVGAFLVTNRQWTAVERRQVEINRLYSEEAQKIEQVKILEQQKAEMLEKAEIVSALVEKVPRSVLLAELINRMPEEMSLTKFELNGTRVKEAPPPADPKAKFQPRGKSLAGKTAKEEKPAPPKPSAPKFDFALVITGFARTDQNVADYHAALRRCQFLQNVELVSSVEQVIEENSLRKFRIEAKIDPESDVRKIEPLQVPRGGTRAAGPDGVLKAVPGWLKNAGFVAGTGKDTHPPEPQPAFREGEDPSAFETAEVPADGN